MATTGAWLIHPVLIIAGKIVVDTVPGMTQELSWTLVNLIYLGVRSHVCYDLMPAVFKLFFVVLVSDVPLGHWNSVPIRLARRGLRRSDSMGAN
jgi:hypothetical protein